MGRGRLPKYEWVANACGVGVSGNSQCHCNQRKRLRDLLEQPANGKLGWPFVVCARSVGAVANRCLPYCPVVSTDPMTFLAFGATTTSVAASRDRALWSLHGPESNVQLQLLQRSSKVLCDGPVTMGLRNRLFFCEKIALKRCQRRPFDHMVYMSNVCDYEQYKILEISPSRQFVFIHCYSVVQNSGKKRRTFSRGE